MRRSFCLKFACAAALAGGLASGLPYGFVVAAPPAETDEATPAAEAAKPDAEPAAPVSPELAAEVRSLLRQLDAPELARRDAAEARLLELGPGVVELLPGASDRLSAEVRQRVERVRGKLELARAEKFVQPSRVTLKGRLKLSAILKSVAEQTGNTITDYRKEFGQDADDIEVELAIDNVEFWLALEQLLEKTDLVLYPYAEKGGLAIVSRDVPAATNPLRRLAGVFRLEPTQLVAERNLQDQRHSVQLRLAIAWEPRMKPLALWLPLESIAGSDNLGNVISAGEPGNLEAPANPGTTAVELMVPLSPPPREAAKITSLKGKLTALVPGRIETFTFGDLPKARDVEQRRAGGVVVLEQVRKNNALWELRVRVRYDETGQALESHRGWVFENAAYLLTPDGQRRVADAYETTRHSEQEVGIAYLFEVPEGLAGMKFVYETPTVFLKLPVEFELGDLELP
ncbi:MAG: hypothetical protein K2Y37_06135 [Pirellulales bacterium]|nr:hypothetical protein [Pirellulales bacterium]